MVSGFREWGLRVEGLGFRLEGFRALGLFRALELWSSRFWAEGLRFEGFRADGRLAGRLSQGAHVIPDSQTSQP